MNRRTLAGDTVVLLPSGDGSVQIGVAPADDGMLRPLLTIHTAELGNFAVILTADDLALLAAASKTLLSMNAEQAQQLRAELARQPEGDPQP